MRVRSGSLLLATAGLHTAVGVIVGVGIVAPRGHTPRNVFAEYAHAGFFASVEDEPVRSTLFWFLFAGFFMAILGVLMNFVESRGEKLPVSVAWGMGAICLLGVMMMPDSGFWLGLPQAVLIWARARPRQTIRGPVPHEQPS